VVAVSLRPMFRWAHTEIETGHLGPGGHQYWEVWRCLKCGKELDPYPRPWRWLWVRVKRTDLRNEIFEPSWWLGSVGSLQHWYDASVLFTVIPLNRIVDAAVRIYHWLRYCHGDKWSSDLAESYQRGKREGEANAMIAATPKVINRVEI
jgi:hypothetical protein